MYSQNQEEPIILAYFSKNMGKLLDIGAYDGEMFSNTRQLLEDGWTGVMVEASPVNFVKLMEATDHMSDRLQLWNVALVPDKSGPMAWHDSCGDAVSTLSDKHLEKWAHHGEWRKFYINTLNVMDFFERVGTDYDFLILDVEGINYELLMAMPYDLLNRLKLICIEYDSHMQAVTDYLNDFGFKVIHRNGENLIFAK